MLRRRQHDFVTSNRYDLLTGCWNWTGLKYKNGYGLMHYDGRNERVHRVSAHIYLKFDLRSKLYVLHSCDNRLCFNPKHLFIGTAKMNTVDSVEKLRHANARKTHCPRGHEYSGGNVYVAPSSGKRSCKKCIQARHERG